MYVCLYLFIHLFMFVIIKVVGDELCWICWIVLNKDWRTPGLAWTQPPTSLPSHMRWWQHWRWSHSVGPGLSSLGSKKIKKIKWSLHVIAILTIWNVWKVAKSWKCLDEESENLRKWMEMGEWHAPTLTRPNRLRITQSNSFRMRMVLHKLNQTDAPFMHPGNSMLGEALKSKQGVQTTNPTMPIYPFPRSGVPRIINTPRNQAYQALHAILGFYWAVICYFGVLYLSADVFFHAGKWWSMIKVGFNPIVPVPIFVA